MKNILVIICLSLVYNNASPQDKLETKINKYERELKKLVAKNKLPSVKES